MAKLRGLHLRGKTYYSRIVVPTALVARFGRKQIWKSLGTSRRSDAEALHLREAGRWAAAFAEAQRAAVVPSPAASALSDDEVAALARRFFARSKAALDLRSASPAALDDDERELVREDLQQQLGILATWQNPDVHLLVGQAAREALTGASNEPRLLVDERLAELVRRALMQLVALELARLDGDYRDRLGDAFFANAPAQVDRGERSATLSECLARYQREVLDLKPVTAKTAAKQRSLLHHVGLFFGRSTRITEVSRSDCNRFRDTLAKLPPNFSKTRGSRSLEQLARSNKSGRTLSWETQNNYLRMLEDLLRWCVRERMVADNVGEDVAPLVKRPIGEDQRLPFASKELKAIFSSPLYRGCEDDGRRFAIRGPNIIRRSRYWVPLIALYSGLRMGEILQLTPAHVRKSASGTRYFLLTRDMTLKTAAAEREVPIHNELIRLGFVDWVKRFQQHSDRYWTLSDAFLHPTTSRNEKCCGLVTAIHPL
ncbi:hypothetical protein LZ016_01945 [Sphingomonas sp. SM33]|uniref:DUF6538 domain-containing protein n=1 Tax=Sphingomonas telluris TaxID=2907998 RepID=A0ABS9VK44_9SPHN|nr:DUF6538 domain-containing protein [Sphingomonas telluris]MCH8614869.1 hypothetical protein [Sphingomonas telluris]